MNGWLMAGRWLVNVREKAEGIKEQGININQIIIKPTSITE